MRLYGCVLLLLIGPSVIAQNKCSTKAEQGCSVSQAGYQRVFETLSKGSGNNIELADTPASSFPLHLFKDGIELSPSSEYTIDGRTLKLLGDAATTPGQFQVAYFVSSPAGRQIVQRQDPTNSSAAAKRIMNAYLKRSLDVELNGKREQASQPVKSLVTESAVRAGGFPPMTGMGVDDDGRSWRGEEPPAASFRMLESILATRSQAARRSRTKGRKNGSAAETEDGLEGLGDVLTASPFDRIRLNAPDSVTDHSRREQLRGQVDAKEPASMRMLRQLQQSR